MFEIITESELFSLDKTLGLAPQDKPIFKQLKHKGEYINLFYSRQTGWVVMKGFRSISTALNHAKKLQEHTQNTQRETMTEQKEQNVTINKENRFILDTELETMTDGEFYLMLHKDFETEDFVLGHVYRYLTKESKAYMLSVLKQEMKFRGLELDLPDIIKQAKDITDEQEPQTVTETVTMKEVNFDTKTALLEAIKSSDINQQSIFAKSRVIDQITEKIDLTSQEIEDYLSSSSTIINEAATTENAIFTQIKDALIVIQPVHKPTLKIDMTESQIWSEISNNQDWLLESKIKTYLTAKRLEYKKKITAHREVSTTVFKDPILEMNKLQLQIVKDIKPYTSKELNQINTMIEEGVQNYKILKETLDITPPKDNSILSRYIRHTELREQEEMSVLFEQVEAYLKEQMNGSKKTLKTKVFFDYKSIIEFNTDQDLKFLNDYKIILKEDNEHFYYNVVSKIFTQDLKQPKEVLTAQIEEDYIKDLLKSKKTLERKYKGKNFVSTPADDKQSFSHLDTNGFRIHLYQNPDKDKTINYNLEYYPSNYKKSDLTENEQFYDSLLESMTANKLEKYLLNGEHIFIPDTGVVLWYSTSDKKYMIDMEPKTFKEVFTLYKKENKRHNNTLTNK